MIPPNPVLETTPTTGRTLVSKLAKVMTEVGKLKKEGFNEHFRYKFVKEADLVEKLSKLLGDAHIFITSVVKSIEILELLPTPVGGGSAKRLGVVRVVYTFHDGESGETLDCESIGEIEQDGGKGVYKALTGAMKYFLMKQFLVATGDDPEQEAKPKAVTPAKPTATKVPPAPAAPQATVTTKSGSVDPAAPVKAAASVPPAKPSLTKVLESLTDCKDRNLLEALHTRAITVFRWTEEDNNAIQECYGNVLKKLAPIDAAAVPHPDTAYSDDERQGMKAA